MSSIAHNFGKKHQYAELNTLSSNELKKSKNIVLIVIDGLGYNYLKGKKESFLFQHLRNSITSTFLATTTCANTVFHVGYPPQQHGLTGWDINLKEVGSIVSLLPLAPMYDEGLDLVQSGFDMNQIMDIPSFHKGLNCKCFTLIDSTIAHSSFNNYVSKNTEMIPTTSYKNSFTKLKKLILKKSSTQRFIHNYIWEFDSCSHAFGVGSKESNELFEDLDKRVKNLANSIKNTNTQLIIVADHGFIDVSRKTEIWTEDIKGFKDCLTIPLAGESRVRNCFIRPNKVKDFKKIVKSKMSKYCWCFKGEQLIKDNLYGLGKPNKKLIDRVGDYVLIMKGKYILRDRLVNQDKAKNFHPGKHGGVSEDEMLIPLVVIDC